MRILVVDPYREVGELTALVLREAGHDSMHAGDGGDALAILRDFAPELVLLDVELVGEDAAEIARRLRQDAPHALYLVLYTALLDDHARVRAVAPYIDQHLLKPASRRTLESVISKARETLEVS